MTQPLPIYEFIGSKHTHEGRRLVKGDLVQLTDRQAHNLRDKFKLVLPSPASTEPATDPVTGLRLDGPTLETYVAAGYTAAGYPPQGYAEIPSPGLEAHKLALLTPPVPDPAPAVPEPAQDPERAALLDAAQAAREAEAAGTTVEFRATEVAQAE